MKAKVPSSELGSTSAAISVARTLCRKAKMTRITRPSASSSVKFTSCSESLTKRERSKCTCRRTLSGSSASICGSIARMRSATATVFAPGWRCTASTMARVPLYQVRALSFSTLSTARPRSFTRSAAPSR